MSTRSAGQREEIAFAGKRVRYTSTASYDRVLARLHEAAGDMPLPELLDVSGDREDYEARVNLRLGSSGFVLVAALDHGPWIAKFGVNRRAQRWIFGNPLVAITMIRHDIVAGLFVPPDLILVENEGGQGCYVLYVEPSSHMVVENNPPLLAAARELDEKIAAFVAGATAD